MRVTTLLAILFLIGFTTQNGYAQSDVIMTIEDELVTLEDFEAIFRKNNRDTVTTVESLDEYIELFINFKLKVQEAKSLGMDTVQDFKTELLGYRRQLARPYMTDTDMLDQLITEAYERKKEEVRASHILIKLDKKATPQDTLSAWETAQKVRADIIAGADFSELATKISDDPSGKTNGGDLGYFSAFQMVYPFEDAAFNTPVGGLSQPVRTRFGYHVLKITDKRPARGEIRAAHIMVRPANKKDQLSADKAQKKIEDIYAQLESGSDFAEMAQKYSEDASTSKKGGELPWFGTGKMVEDFEDIAFALNEDGDYSAPFQTEYGWHIAKRLEYRPIATFEEMKKELKNKVSRDARAEKTKTSFVSNLMSEYNFTVVDKILTKIHKGIDTTISQVRVKEKLLAKSFITLDGKSENANGYVDYLEERLKKRRGANLENFANSAWKEYSRQYVLNYEDSRLEEKHNAFRLLMNEYRDGILLFELTDQKVWSKAVKDTTGLEEFYAGNKDKFLWEERVDATIYTCKSTSISAAVIKSLKKGKSKAEILTRQNAKSELNLQVKEGIYLKEDEDILAKIDWKEGISESVELDDQHYVVLVNRVIPKEPKKLDEARGLVTAEYQNHLEDEWISFLRNKYKYTVNKDVLYRLAQ